jgi:hypothetical protein
MLHPEVTILACVPASFWLTARGLHQASPDGIVLQKMVDRKRIELSTGALQVLLAPLVHAGPFFNNVLCWIEPTYF